MVQKEKCSIDKTINLLIKKNMNKLDINKDYCYQKLLKLKLVIKLHFYEIMIPNIRNLRNKMKFYIEKCVSKKQKTLDLLKNMKILI